MLKIRIALGVLSIIPFALFLNNAFLPIASYMDDSPYIMAFYFFGIPILIFNYWAWFSPIIIERLLFIKE
jgi:hypothetical protein